MIDIYQEPMRLASAVEERKLTPVMLPFIINNSFFFMMILFMIIYFFSDIPFIKKKEQYIIGRMGRKRWGIWNCLYLLIWSVILSFCLNFIAVMNVGRAGDWLNLTKWRGLVREFAMTNAREQYGAAFQISYPILKNYTPLELLLWQLLLLTLGIFLVGMLMYTISLYAGKLSAILLAFALTAIPNYLDRPFELPNYIYYFLPTVWMRSVYWRTTETYQYPDMVYIVVAEGLVLSILIVLSLWKVQRMDLKEE
jgi:hypothetical protein